MSATGTGRTRVPGHALTLEWSGEYGIESSSTGTCKCGWAESASSQREVRYEYRWHLAEVLERLGRAAPAGLEGSPS